ncbi:MULTISPECIES: porin [unclassified Rhodosalinus]|uniref:porin n=1 Tax=unclassified Rhodosalinus TaxID=2630183 RepID=UPI00352571DD
MSRIDARVGPGLTFAAVIAGTSAGAQTFENDTGGSVRFYGQASPSYLSFDDGEETTGKIVDNSNSNTRFGFAVTQPMSDGDLVFTFETGLGFRQSALLSQSNTPPTLDWRRTALRRLEAAYTADFGTLAIGQGFMATDNVATLDPSGTALVVSVGVSDAAFAFREKSGALSDVRVIDAFKEFDGARLFRIRYDTPTYSGFSGAVSYGRNVLAEDDDTDYYDIALRWSGTQGDFALAAAAGYAWEDEGNSRAPGLKPGDVTTNERYSGSFSLLHTPTGLNLSASAGGDPDGGNYGFVRAGWVYDVTSQGPTALAVSYYGGSDVAEENSSSEGVGFAAMQTFTDLDLDVYLGYREYYYDDDAASYQDASSVFLGARFKF